MFIESQPHISTENNPEGWRERGSTSVNKEYRGQQHSLCHQHSQYNDHQKYWHNRTAQNDYLFNTDRSEKQDHQSNIHSEMPTPSRKYDPIIPNEPF